MIFKSKKKTVYKPRFETYADTVRKERIEYFKGMACFALVMIVWGALAFLITKIFHIDGSLVVAIAVLVGLGGLFIRDFKKRCERMERDADKQWY